MPIPMRDTEDIFYNLGCTQWKNLISVNSIPENPRFQSEWDKPLYFKRQKELLQSAPSDTERARILGTSSAHASDWLHAIPVSSL